MARKTQNSSQSLPSAVAQTLLTDEVPPPRTSGRKTRHASHNPTTKTAYTTSQKPMLHDDDGAADSRHNADDTMEMDATDDQVREPAVIAPSVRPSKEGRNGQAGLVDENGDTASAIPRLGHNEESCNVLDDDDYAGVDDISDSSDEEPDVETVTKKINIDAKPTTNHLRWYEHEEMLQVKLGEDESFFDQHHWANDSGSSVAASDDFDYHTAWDGLPDTPVEPRTPMSLPSLSRHPSCFESPTSSRRPPSSGLGTNHSDDDDAAKKPTSVQFDEGAVDNDAESGYDSDAEITDEEGPPIPAVEIIRAPHVIHHSPLTSVDASLVDLEPKRTSTTRKKFKVPSLPASRLRPGPKLGTFKLSPSRSFSMANKTGNGLTGRRATHPSPRRTPPQVRSRNDASYSAPPTPSISHATLSLAPDLSEPEFLDVVPTQSLADPVLSSGPDFVTSAGFSHSTSTRIPQTTKVPQPTESSFQLVPQDGFDGASFLDLQARGVEPQFDDPEDEDIGEFAFEDMIDFGDLSSDAQESVISASSPVRSTFAADPASPSGQATTQRNSPSSASPSRGLDLLGGVDISAWMNSAGQRSQSRHPSRRPPHGLSLSGNTFRGSRNPSSPSTFTKKRKISEVHGRSTPPVSMNKRRLPVGPR